MVSDLDKRHRELQKELEALRAERDRLEKKTASLEEKATSLEEQLGDSERRGAYLEFQLEKLRRMLFGQSSEKLKPRDDGLVQLELFEEAKVEIEAEELQDEEEFEEKRKRKRRRIPKDLERQRIEIDVEPELRSCPDCGEEMSVIGEEISETLEYIPALLYVIEYALKKRACKKCQSGVIQAKRPKRPIPRSRPGPGLLAYLLVAKYQDHLPLHRLERVFARGGMEISRKTLCDWVHAVASLLGPIVLAMRREILRASLLQIDESPTPVKDPEVKGKAKDYWLWSYGVPEEEVVFDFARGRSSDEPIRFLEDFGGYIQSDGYPVYKTLEKRSGNVLVGCWAHVRRKFFDARAEDPNFAMPVLAAMQKLFRLETKATEDGIGREDLLELRREKALPILETLKAVLESHRESYVPESGLGNAVRHALRRWETLVRYVDIAEAPMANQSAEQSFRPLALGKNNWLFVGHPDAGKSVAIVYSLIESCRRLGADPFTYLKSVIETLAEEPERAADLTPRKWLVSQASGAAENVAS